jgi:hypothetical protein
MQLEGGWSKTRKEYSKIVSDIHRDGKFLAMRITASIRQTGKQIGDFSVGDGNVSFDKGSQLYETINRWFPSDGARYLKGRQVRSYLPHKLFAFNAIINFGVVMVIVLLLVFLHLHWSRVTASFKLFLLITIVGIVINCWDCGTFAQVNGRYGCRVMWLLPFCALLALNAVGSAATSDKKEG